MPLLTIPQNSRWPCPRVLSRIRLSCRVGVTSAGRGVIGRWLMSYACAAQPPRHVCCLFWIGDLQSFPSEIDLTFLIHLLVDEPWDLRRTWEVPA
jgi:hypothetical protein